MNKHESFLWGLAGKLGAPIFAGTLVACLIQGQFDLTHLLLMATGITLLAISHWHDYH